MTKDYSEVLIKVEKLKRKLTGAFLTRDFDTAYAGVVELVEITADLLHLLDKERGRNNRL